jgi:cell filamentation protein
VTDNFVDPYIDPKTGLLTNLVGATTQAELDAAEGALSFTRLVQLSEHPQAPTGDLAELRSIHGQLFRDVYPFAGELRTVDIRKNVEGAEFFLPVSMIERASSFAAGELREDKMLHGFGRDQFIDRLSYHYDAFNYIHPAREGNGRTGRVFWNRVATDAGWQLDWRSVHGQVNDNACRVASEQRDFGPMRDMFDQIVTPAVSPADRDAAWRAAELARMSFPMPTHGAVDQAHEAKDTPPGRSRPTGLYRSPESGLER